MYSLTEIQDTECVAWKLNYFFWSNIWLICISFYFRQIYNISAYDKKKSPKQQPSEEIQVASNPDIKIITGTKLKYLSEKRNDYDTNHVFQVLDESTLKEWIQLEEDMNKPVLEYNGKYHLKVNAVKIKELPVETVF